MSRMDARILKTNTRQFLVASFCKNMAASRGFILEISDKDLMKLSKEN